MIGGKDIYLKTPSEVPALDCALRTIRLFWPKAVFENGITAEVVSGYRQVAFSGMREVLVYKDSPALKKWEELGADPSLQGTMIHLIASSEELAVIVDEEPSVEIEEIVESIRHGLRVNPFGRAQKPEAA